MKENAERKDYYMEKNIFQKYPRVFWGGAAAIILLIIIPGLLMGWIYTIDWPITHALNQFRYSVIEQISFDEFHYVFKNFSDTIFIPTLLFVTVGVCAFARKKNLFWLLILNAVAIKLINMGLKFLVDRPRPFVQEPWLIPQNEWISETSFPSGHAMLAVAFYGLLIYLIWTYTRGKEGSRPVFWSVFLGILIFCILFSRVFLSVHFTSDVVAGTCFSILWLCFYTKWVVPLFIGKPDEPNAVPAPEHAAK